MKTGSQQLNVLMLHEHTQCPSSFDGLTRPLQEHMRNVLVSIYPLGVRLVFAQAPFRVQTTDIDGKPDADPPRAVSDTWTWCEELTVRPGSAWYDNGARLMSLEMSLDSIAEIIRTKSPFDGIIGFSFGAGVALLIASLLESGRKRVLDQLDGPANLGFPKSFISTTDTAIEQLSSIQTQLKFTIVFSGLAAEHDFYKAFYKLAIETPTLHILAKCDTIVEKRQSMALVNACKNVEPVIYHPGAHFVPRQGVYILEVAVFIKRCCKVDGTCGRVVTEQVDRRFTLNKLEEAY